MTSRRINTPGHIHGSRTRSCLFRLLLLGLLSCSFHIHASEAASPPAVPEAASGPMSASEALGRGFRTVFGGKNGGNVRQGGRRRRRSSLGFKYYTSGAETVQNRYADGDSATEDDRQRQIEKQRRVEDNNNNNNDDDDDDAAAAAADDDYYHADDDGAAAANDDAAADDAAENDDYNYSANYDDDDVNEACSQYLMSFLEGTSDARDTCEGIMNAYTAAGELHIYAVCLPNAACSSFFFFSSLFLIFSPFLTGICFCLPFNVR